MKTKTASVFFPNSQPFSNHDAEEAFYCSIRKYSLIKIPNQKRISEEKLMEALEKSLRVCQMAGINSQQHYKKMYVYDTDNQTVHIDWRMSKRGFNLMLMQMSSENEKMAKWLWELSDF
jgi:hypothetical protein